MTLLYLFVITILGILTSYLFLKKISLLTRVSIGFGLGLLVISLILFSLMAIEIPLSRNTILYSVGSIVLIVLLLNVRQSFIKDIKKAKLPNFKEVSKGKEKYLWIFVVIIGAFLLFEATYWPISDWDALTLYDFRGKIFAEGQLFKDLQILDSFDTYNAGYYFSYPPFTSLIHTFFYSLGLSSPQIIYPIALIALVIFFYKSLEYYVHKKIAYIFSAVLFLTNTLLLHARLPYTNLFYTYFYFISSLLLIRFITGKRKDTGMLFMSALFLAGSSWARFVEPFYLVNILFLIFVAFRKKIPWSFVVLFGVPILGLRYIWKNVLGIYAKQSFLTNINIIALAEDILSTGWDAALQAGSVFYGFVYENILLFSILAISTLLYLLEKRKEKSEIMKWFLIFVYLNLSIIILGTFAVGILLPGRSEIYASIDRIGMFLYPFIIFIAALCTESFLNFQDPKISSKK